MANNKQITQEQLLDKIRDIDTPDEELAKYFEVDESASTALSPVIVPKRRLVKPSDLEGSFFIGLFNRAARSRRNNKYRRRMARGWSGIKVVAEGDSWFQYPFILKDTIDQLIDSEHFQYAIYGLSEAGDLLRDIIKEDEITEAIERENPDIFLISGGGNDMVGDSNMTRLVHKFSANRKPENYPNRRFDTFLNDLSEQYRGLFSRLLVCRPHLKIFCHGYDRAIPNKGSWLGKPLAKQNITDTALQQNIIAHMIDRFNDMLIAVAAEFPGAVYHVDCRDLIGSKSKWHDELHPKDAGYFAVAQRFDETIKKALAENAASPAVRLETSDRNHGAPIQLSRLSKLSDNTFINTVVNRARTLIDDPVAMPANKEERKELEREIDQHFEKIHKDNNFLPSSFLEIGVTRAQAVCRISTDTSWGSGFLIGSRQFIITNNHVIPSASVARVSAAEFDYDEDDIVYHVRFDPDRLFITNKELDFTIVACDSSPLPDTIEPILLLSDPYTVTRNERVNIIQHPQGRTKEISLHDNKVSYIYDLAIRYTADTEGGSSGSPVFNNQWNLVALHHAGFAGANGAASNEGIRIKAIVDHLLSRRGEETSTSFNELLACIHEEAPAAPFPPANDSERAKPSVASVDKHHITVNWNGDVKGIDLKVTFDD